jgi:hypothetical protein
MEFFFFLREITKGFRFIAGHRRQLLFRNFAPGHKVQGHSSLPRLTDDKKSAMVLSAPLTYSNLGQYS